MCIPNIDSGPRSSLLHLVAPALGRSCLELLLSAMAQFDIQRALCVNNVVVPGDGEGVGAHDIVDPYKLSELGEDVMSVALVHFKASEWSAQVPVQPMGDQGPAGAILCMVENVCTSLCYWRPPSSFVTRRARGCGDKRAESILPLKVQGKVLWFLNSHKCVSLALREDKAKAEAEGQEVVQEDVQGIAGARSRRSQTCAGSCRG